MPDVPVSKSDKKNLRNQTRSRPSDFSDWDLHQNCQWPILPSEKQTCYTVRSPQQCGGKKKPVEGDWPKTVKLTPGTATGHFNTRLFNADVSQLSVNWPLITNGSMCLIRQVGDRIHRCGPILITCCPPHSCVSEPIPLSPFAVQVLEKIYRHRTDEKHAKIEKMAFKNA